MIAAVRFALVWAALGVSTAMHGQSASSSPRSGSEGKQAPSNETVPQSKVPQSARCAEGKNDIPRLRSYGLKVVNLWVSHGDATLIFLPNGEIALVDTGQDFAVKEYVLPFLEQHGIDSLDYLIVTHYHGDHYSGKIEKDGKVYLGYRWDPDGKRIPVKNFWDNKTFHQGDGFNWGGAWMTILNSAYNEPLADDENYRSLSFVIDYNGFRYGIGGDIYARQQERILVDQPNDVRVHVYRTNHHLHGSTSEEYLRAADPFIFITSAEGAVYERTAYTVNFQNVISDLRAKRSRFLESLLTLENGNILVWANNDKDWGYTCKPSGEKYPLP